MHGLQSSVLVLNVDDLVSALARHVTSPSSSEPSGSRQDDPGLSARVMHSVKRLHMARANDNVQTTAEMRRRCSVLLRPRLWLRSGCGCRCRRPVKRDMLAPMPPRPPVVKFACRGVSQWISSHRKRRILYESWGRVRSVLSSLEAISDDLADRADLCSYILHI